ncbi:hypothetical protein Taro_029240 [Colocasia esculenta]|uniref:Thioredoxin domain-containing protein n=1 Tax=Colocasia esculenta TaxID=4460 RepID=A0A843VWN0_COLES|nr:hypothetical protein [Colocasia esculenta]
MDPDSFQSTMSSLAFGNVMAAAARDYKKVGPFFLGASCLSFSLLILTSPSAIANASSWILSAQAAKPSSCFLAKSPSDAYSFALRISSAYAKIWVEVLSQQKAQPSSATNPEVDLDELMDDPELERLHADRIAALKKEAEKREALKRKGHGEFREVTEGDFLGEVTGSERVICHFYHREFYRCKIMDKHLKALAPRYVDTKFMKLDAENAPFFVAKLAVKTLPCVILFRKGIAIDRLVGFQDLGSKDDFSTKTLENVLIRKGILDAQKEEKDDDDDDDGGSRSRTVRSSTIHDSDSD